MAKRIKDVTEEEWSAVNPLNRHMVEEYLDSLATLSPKTLTQYTSGLKI